MSGLITRMRAATAAAIVTMLAAGAWSLMQSPAVASTASIGINIPSAGTAFTASPSGTLINVSRLAPGVSANGVMGVRNGSSNPAALSVQFVDVHSSENGCVHPELAMPGGCDPDGPGQLPDALTFSLGTSSSRDGAYNTVWTGSAAELQSGVRVGDDLTAHGTEWVRLTLGLPGSVGNEVQSDTYGFNVLVTLSDPVAAGVAGSSFGIAGVSTVRGVESLGVGPSSAGGLALTGVPMMLLIGAGLLLVLCGALVAMGFRERRQQ